MPKLDWITDQAFAGRMHKRIESEATRRGIGVPAAEFTRELFARLQEVAEKRRSGEARKPLHMQRGEDAAHGSLDVILARVAEIVLGRQGREATVEDLERALRDVHCRDWPWCER